MILRYLPLILFLIFPILELYLMIQVGTEIGAIWTITIIVFTGVLGGLLLRQQGFSSMMRVRESMNRGEVPALPLFEGLVVVIAAIFLIIPGFITDAIGIFFLVTPIRQWLIRHFIRFQQIKPSTRPDSPAPDKKPPKRIIDGEYTVDDDK
jgi:UPF0716 protein FxsA